MSADFMFGGRHDENLSAETPEDYLDAVDALPGQLIEVFEYRRKQITPEACLAEVRAAFDSIREGLEVEYAGDGPIGLEDLETEWAEVAGKALFDLVVKRGVEPWQCEVVDSCVWEFDGKNWSQAAVLE